MSATPKQQLSIEERLAQLEERQARDTELILKGMAAIKQDNEERWNDNAWRWQQMREEVSRKLDLIFANIWDAEKVRRDKWAYQLNQEDEPKGE
jgi:hypothetical protein